MLAGLWTSVCIVGPALSALEQGFEIYIVTDACGDVTDEAHERGVQRMVQAGARPMTSSSTSWSCSAIGRAAKPTKHHGHREIYGGSYGLGVIYAKTMFGAGEVDDEARPRGGSAMSDRMPHRI